MLEEELKNRIATKFFKKFDCDAIVKRIDFCVSTMWHTPLMWAEAKQQPTDIYKMLAQLLLTIKQDVYDDMPPKFLGCFDSEKISFIQYYDVLQVFNLNDFNWVQTPSNVDEKTIETVRNTINADKIFTFRFDDDEQEIHNFIEENFKDGGTLLSTLIDRNNFIFVYQKWHKMVKPYINADWDKLKRQYGIYDRDFFLAELNIDDNNTPEVYDDKTAYPDFYITFNANSSTPYILSRTDEMGLEYQIPFRFKNGGLEKYTDFWKRYKRPPKNMYWNYIINRLDLLVPQDIRERKGAFFTPQIWVEKSQSYLANYLGEKWQDEYYIWDCCAGTGNLLNGLVNKYNVYASTIDYQDVEVMKDRIKNGAMLLESHVFQFDFLNDEFLPKDYNRGRFSTPTKPLKPCKLPQSLYDILTDPEKRKKLVIYINPPYAEATASDTINGNKRHKAGVSDNITYTKYINKLGRGINEVFVHFLARIYYEIPDAYIAHFSTLKILTAQNFTVFRNNFQAKLEKLFLVPGNSFDNVKGQFPIGFFIWNTQKRDSFKMITADTYDIKNNFYGKKKVFAVEKNKVILNWMAEYYDNDSERLAYMVRGASDFQNNQIVFITLNPSQAVLDYSRTHNITAKNLMQSAIFFTVRHLFEKTWLNNQDQFLYPNKKWESDIDFHTNCLIYTLFHGKNNVSSKYGVNHWIPFDENEVNAPDIFKSHFMHDFIFGKVSIEKRAGLFSLAEKNEPTKLKFSAAANAVLDCGREIWKYYFTMEDSNANASFYDIREYFQGRNNNGKMNANSKDKVYTELMEKLKESLRQLGEEIKPKVYEYGFLM